jgi:hypothetical protein
MEGRAASFICSLCTRFDMFGSIAESVHEFGVTGSQKAGYGRHYGGGRYGIERGKGKILSERLLKGFMWMSLTWSFQSTMGARGRGHGAGLKATITNDD